jgi:Protein of unknown function (DUF2946)
MRAHTTSQRSTALLAVLALLWATLVPGLAHALQSSSESLWVEVCTVQGPGYVRLDSEALAADPLAPLELGKKSSAWGEHCPLCTLPIDHAAPPPLLPAGATPALGFERPLAFWRAPRLLAVWATAQARAPPLTT